MYMCVYRRWRRVIHCTVYETHDIGAAVQSSNCRNYENRLVPYLLYSLSQFGILEHYISDLKQLEICSSCNMLAEQKKNIYLSLTFL